VSHALLRLIVVVAIACAAPLGAQAQRGPTSRPVAGATNTPPAAATTNAPGDAAASPPTATPTAPVDSSYLIGPGDVVDLSLVGRNDFGGRVRVGADGTMLLPYVGTLKVADKTVMELADVVRQALIKGGFFADPVVRVEVVGISSRYATALGAVGSPGLIPLDRNYRLSEIMAKLGGKGASGTDYVVLTHAGQQPKRYPYAKLAAGGPEDDPMVVPGDKIYVPPQDSEVFYISGQVNSPGAYPATDGLTVRMAIAKGGGVTLNGSENKVKIIRDGKPLKGIKLEDPIKPGDLVSIGERLF